MAKKKQHIDDFFKSQLQGSELPLDGSEWARMSKALGHEKKKRRFFWWWFFGAFVLLVGIAGLGSLWINNGDQANVETTSKTEKSQAGLKHSSATEAEIEARLTDATPSKEGDIALVEAKASPNTAKTSTPISNTDGNRVYKNLDLTTRPNNAIVSGNSDPIDDIVDDNSDVNSDLDVFNELPGLLDYKLVDIETEIANPWTLRSKIKRKDAPQILPVYLGFTGALQVNQQTTGGNNSNEVNSINANEFSRLTPSFGLELKFLTNNNWSINSGLRYQVQGQSLGSAFSRNPAITIEIYDSIPVLNPQGDTTDWLPYNYRDTTLNSNLSNPSLNYLSFSLGISKSIPFGHRWGLNVGLEIRPKILLNAGGTSVAYNSIGTNQDINQFNRFGLSGGLNLGVHYQLSPNYMVQWDVFSQFDFNDIRARSDIHQRYRLYGSRVGIYYRLR